MLKMGSAENPACRRSENWRFAGNEKYSNQGCLSDILLYSLESRFLNPFLCAWKKCRKEGHEQSGVKYSVCLTELTIDSHMKLGGLK